MNKTPVLIQDSLDLPTKEQILVREKIIKVFNWLVEHRDHKEYQRGVEFIATRLEKENIIDWFLGQDINFEVSIDIYNSIRVDEQIDIAKKIFNV